jgi:hypothetical protein
MHTIERPILTRGKNRVTVEFSSFLVVFYKREGIKIAAWAEKYYLKKYPRPPPADESVSPNSEFLNLWAGAYI